MHALTSRILRGDVRAVARALTDIENDAADKRALLQSLYPYSGRAHVVGFTGSPGAGKSTLVNRAIRFLRDEGLQVGVLAVDPSSPFTGGALLGDRVRMTSHSTDPGVYIRSVGSRGSLGGLGKSTREMMLVLEAYGCDIILLETVGVGQAELDVMSVADTVALVLTPGAGDDVQTAKAGIMEIADVFIVNKADLPGTPALVKELQLMLHEKTSYREDWMPPIVQTIASADEGISELWQTFVNHRQHLKSSGYWKQRRQRLHREETLRIIESRFSRRLRQLADENDVVANLLVNDVQADPFSTAEAILAALQWDI